MPLPWIEALMQTNASLRQKLADWQAYVDSLVPQNSTDLSTCLSAEKWHQLYGTVMPASAMTDDFGCAIDPSSGYRLPEDCYLPGAVHAAGTLCDPNRSGGHDAYARTDFGDFVSTIMPFVQVIAPVIGTAVMKTIGPLVSEIAAKIGGTGTFFLSDELANLVDSIESRATDFLHGLGIDPSSIHARDFVDTLKKLGATAKAIGDAVRPALMRDGVVDPRSILSYQNLKQGLGFMNGILSNDPKSILSLHHLGVETGLNVHDWKSARLWQDAKKTLSTVQTGADLFADKYGVLTPESLNTVARDAFSKADDVVARDGVFGAGLELSNALADRYAGKATEMVAALDPRKLAALLPDPNMRADFFARMSTALAWDAMLAPAVKEAERRFSLDLADVNNTIEDINQLSNVARSSADFANIGAKQLLARTKVLDMQRRADDTIKSAVRTYQQPYEAGYNVPTHI